MANSLALDKTGSILAQELFDRLPPDIQAQYNTPNRIIALNTIDQIPLSEAKIISQLTDSEDHTTIGLQFSSNVDSPKFVKLELNKDKSGDWKIAIPAAVILNYANSLGIELD